jgi:concentrative nucleoside transporter, CNT family
MRIAVNEFEAFLDLREMMACSARARFISISPLCGFAKISSIAIHVGGIGALVPERRGDPARLGWERAPYLKVLANYLSA